MSNPVVALQTLRQAYIDGTPVQLQDGYYLIGDQKFPENTKTIFKRSLKDKDYYYNLKDIVFFYENSKLSVADYRRAVVEAHLSAVVESDRHALLHYLQGKIDTCPQLNFQAAQAIADENAQSSREALAKTAKRESHKRKLAATVQPAGAAGENVNNEDFQALQVLRQDEFSPFNRLTVLNAVGTDFAIALKLFNDRVLKPRDEENAAAAAAAAGEKSSSSSKSSKGIIIVVPTALTSTITMYNAKEFLESGNLTQGEQLPGKKPKFDIIIRKSSSSVHSQTYKLIDDPIKLTNEEWERVGAVFVTGQLWQFKDWKYTEPAELFHHVLGIHLMYDDRHPPTTIQSWNCKLLKVNQYKQHVNAGAAREFWMLMDDFIRLRKPHLIES